MIQAVAGMYYSTRTTQSGYVGFAISKEGGTDPQVRTLLVQSYYLVTIARTSLVSGGFEQSESAGRAPPEDQLQLLATCYAKQKDDTAYAGALEKLVTYYPKKDYWVDLLSRVQRKQGFADRLALDLYRLKLATGNLSTAADYMEMAQLALGDDFTGEAKKIVDRGFTSGVLGAGNCQIAKSGCATSRQRATEGRPRSPLLRQKRGGQGRRALVGGLQLRWLRPMTKASLMEQGVRKGGLKRPEDAKLHLGIALSFRRAERQGRADVQDG
jgi:hypothetical protein